jgi:hypothetical protein
VCFVVNLLDHPPLRPAQAVRGLLGMLGFLFFRLVGVILAAGA